MIFLFPRWDMWIPWRVLIQVPQITGKPWFQGKNDGFTKARSGNFSAPPPVEGLIPPEAGFGTILLAYIYHRNQPNAG